MLLTFSTPCTGSQEHFVSYFCCELNAVCSVGSHSHFTQQNRNANPLSVTSEIVLLDLCAFYLFWFSFDHTPCIVPFFIFFAILNFQCDRMEHDSKKTAIKTKSHRAKWARGRQYFMASPIKRSGWKIAKSLTTETWNKEKENDF